MKRTLALTLAIALLGLGAVGCAQSSVEAPIEEPIAASSPEPEPEPEVPSPTVEVAWFWCDNDPEFPVFRFVAMIHNPGAKAISGLETEWVAYDAEGTIVGSYAGQRAVVPAGETIPYTGGAGGTNLSGVPARVDVTVTNVGSFVDEIPPTFAVSDIEVAADATNEYTVTAKATNGPTEIPSIGIAAAIVLRNQAGEIVGGDFWQSEGLPETLPAGASFKIEVELMPTTGAAVTADVVVVNEG